MASRKMTATGETPYDPLMSIAYGFGSSRRSESGRWANAGLLIRSTASKAKAMRMVFSPLKAGSTAVRPQATSARSAAGVSSAHESDRVRSDRDGGAGRAARVPARSRRGKSARRRARLDRTEARQVARAGAQGSQRLHKRRGRADRLRRLLLLP